MPPQPSQRKARPAGQPSRGNGHDISRHSAASPPLPGAAKCTIATDENAVTTSTSAASATLKLVPRHGGAATRSVNRTGIRMPRLDILPPLFQPGRGARLAGELENMHPGVGAVDDIDVAAIVGLEIVGLDRDLAA